MLQIAVSFTHPTSKPLDAKCIGVVNCSRKPNCAALFELVSDVLEAYNLPWTNVLSLSNLDNASRGRLDGFYAQARAKNKNILAFDSINHQLHSVGTKLAKLPTVAPQMQLLKKLVSYINHSAERRQALLDALATSRARSASATESPEAARLAIAQLVSALGGTHDDATLDSDDKPETVRTKIPTMGPSRWQTIGRSCVVVLEHYAALVEHFWREKESSTFGARRSRPRRCSAR
ncbi:hypothetical protein SDRG_10713 [Saprolegnia diclina VS20]|uniref:Uncharacterized protein n=1 Tax=Saprolegnia diclina (strain VS20) TaxID=1156394 RepID=T0QA65_SAPDV|nr:hypothetical protein SDRG_10713 [Saprolegnia diclina VS20]EQC31541.1 hypothetical protein SDRG_10713 [Saprolegnia diclina VS20]|eukprot:XP_008614940.1 hypothetical protein SDRG_10713 [Saprolegnia diclina VS20]